MARLSASFILAYHGCDATIAEQLLNNAPFEPSRNSYDWLGEGTYFWEANPLRGLEFAREVAQREPDRVKKPAVIGAIIDLGHCLDLTSARGLSSTREAYDKLFEVSVKAAVSLPFNDLSRGLHHLDCAVINYVHRLEDRDGRPPFDSVKGIFIEHPDLYPGSAFGIKNHIQIAIRNADCIKGVFRVPEQHLTGL